MTDTLEERIAAIQEAKFPLVILRVVCRDSIVVTWFQYGVYREDLTVMRSFN